LFRQLVCASIVACAVASESGAQTDLARQGRTIDRRVAVSDTTQAFAIYLPSSYDSTRRLPALLVLDPRGRAMLGLGLFRAAAERLGFVVLSSYNTLSDGAVEPNIAAMNAMLTEVQNRLSVDMSRLYLAGMSGTARLAWSFADELRGHVVGVLAASAGFPPGAANEARSAVDSAFSLFLTTAAGDFNYSEVRSTADRYSAAGGFVRLVITAGGHGWPPDSVCSAALEWLHLRSMRAGLRPLDSAWVGAHFDGELSTARTLEAAGQWDAAAQMFSDIARDYRGSTGASVSAAQLRALDTGSALTLYRTRMRRAMADENARARDIALELARVRTGAGTIAAQELADRLGVTALLSRARGADTVDAPAARRTLAFISVSLSFYEPRAYLDAGRPDQAVQMLRTAALIAPLTTEGCVLARRSWLALRQKDGWIETVCPVAPTHDRYMRS
jgi:predicted esterase